MDVLGLRDVGYSFIILGRPDSLDRTPWYNMIMIVGLMGAGFQLFAPYFFGRADEPEEFRIVTTSKGVALLAILVEIVVTGC